MTNCSNIIFSSVSLRRNIKDMLFVNRLSDFEQAVSVARSFSEIYGEKLEFKSLKNIPLVDCQKLQEKGIITRELIENKDISAYGVNEDTSIRIYANEQDHIRIETKKRGESLEWCYKNACELDDILLDKLEVAFDNNLGYLTANPNLFGTGMELSVGMFLPALITSGKLKKIVNSVISSDFELLGITGDKWNEKSLFVLIKNKFTFGLKENEFAEKLVRIVNKLNELEQVEENNLFNLSASILVDDIFRAYAILTNAYRINAQEAEEKLGYILWGINLNVLTCKNYDFITLLYKTKESHLAQKNIKEQEKERAKFLCLELGKILHKGDVDV